jgi:hypothetical protein
LRRASAWNRREDGIIFAEACVSFVVGLSGKLLATITRRRVGCAGPAALVRGSEGGSWCWSAGHRIEGAWAVDVVEFALCEMSLLDEISENRVPDRCCRVDPFVRHQGGGAVAVAHVEHLRRDVG